MHGISGVVSVIALLGVAGCSSDPDVDIGDGRTGQRLTDYAAVWEGYAEGYDFSDGSDRVRIALDENGDGTLEVGDSAALVTDPDRAPRGARAGLVPGFAYAVRVANVESSRLRLRVDSKEVLSGWCSVQTSHATATPDIWTCMPWGATGTSAEGCNVTPEDTNVKVPYDCDAIQICQLGPELCGCTESGCAIPAFDEAGPVQFGVDAALGDSGDTLEGTLLLGELIAERPIIRLTRQ